MDEIARKLKAKKSAVSYHIGLLKKHGIICKIKRSRFAFYSKTIVQIFLKFLAGFY